jgi:hypothetical protein
MKSISFAFSIVLAGILAAGISAFAAENESAALASLKFFDTGVGLEERETKISGYQAKIVFANLKGEYLADVNVRIRRGSKEKAIHCEGPWLLIKGNPGRYEVIATVGKLVAKRNILLPRKGMKAYFMHLRAIQRPKKPPQKKIPMGV